MAAMIEITMESGDVLEVRSDVLALKYAQALHGADRAVFNRLMPRLGDDFQSLPKKGHFTLHSTRGLISPAAVLFVGVSPLREFGYRQIRDFGHEILTSLAGAAPDCEIITSTIHGPGYGLDEREAFASQLAGIVDAVISGDRPRLLKRIAFVERNTGRAMRLKELLNDLLPNGSITREDLSFIRSPGSASKEILRSAGYESASKPNIFVAMPFVESMDDIFYYGIQGAVSAAGFLCERADLSSFTGDVMDWVKRRIATASLVIADLSTANPNVYLEVGYAWGCGKPTVLVAKDKADLKFDVKNQRCLLYRSIRHLEEILAKELRGLSASPPAIR